MVKLIGSPAAGLDVFLASVFAVGENGALYQLPQVIQNGNWGNWINRRTPPGVTLLSSPAVSLNNFIDLSALNPVAVGGDGGLYALPQHDGGGSWTSFGGSLFPSPAVGVDSSTGVQAVFAVGTDNILQSFSDQYGVGGWTSHPGVSLRPSPAAAQSVTNAPNPQGRYEVFAVGNDGALWHTFQTAVGNGYSDWVSFGAPPSGPLSGSPVIAPSQDGRLEVFVVGSDGALWHIWQPGPPDVWSSWFSHGAASGGAITGSPALLMDAFGKLELLVVGADGALWQINQVAPSDGWSDWFSHGQPPGVALTGSPTLTSSNDGRLELFVIGADGALWHIWQLQKIDNPTINNWSGWFSHGTP
jgi:hypothetical protein